MNDRQFIFPVHFTVRGTNMKKITAFMVCLSLCGAAVVLAEEAAEFAEKYACDHEKLLRELYLKLTSENDKTWHNRTFYGLFKREGSIYFRLVDDSTT